MTNPRQLRVLALRSPAHGAADLHHSTMPVYFFKGTLWVSVRCVEQRRSCTVVFFLNVFRFNVSKLLQVSSSLVVCVHVLRIKTWGLDPLVP